MLIRVAIALTLGSESVEAAKKAVWLRAMENWGDPDIAAGAAYVSPGRLTSWQGNDFHFAADCARLDEEADRRIVEKVRRRALRGDAQALGFGIRAARGMAKSVEVRPPVAESEDVEPEVADAMVSAGLRAMGIDPDDPNFGPLPGFPPPPTSWTRPKFLTPHRGR